MGPKTVQFFFARFTTVLIIQKLKLQNKNLRQRKLKKGTRSNYFKNFPYKAFS